MQSFSFCLLRRMSFLADKIRAKLFLDIGIRNACFFTCFKATHHPDHIFCKVAHRLHPFFVLRRVLRRQPVHHIPVSRACGRHLCDSEIFVQRVQRSRRPASSCDCDCCAGLEFEVFITVAAVKCAIQEIENASARVCKIDWRCEHKAVRILCLFHKFIHTVIRKHTFSGLSTDIALQAICDRLTADLNDLRFNPLCTEYLFHLFNRCHGGSVEVAASIYKHNLHAIKSPFYCSVPAQTGLYCSGWFTLTTLTLFGRLSCTSASVRITPPSKPAKVTAYTFPNLEDVARK